MRVFILIDLHNGTKTLVVHTIENQREFETFISIDMSLSVAPRNNNNNNNNNSTNNKL